MALLSCDHQRGPAVLVLLVDVALPEHLHALEEADVASFKHRRLANLGSKLTKGYEGFQMLTLFFDSVLKPILSK